MRSQKEQNKLNHSSQPGRAPDLDFTITERDPTSTASLASQLSSHCGYYYGRTALSLSLSPHCFLFTEGRDGEVRGGARRRLGRLLLSPVRLRQQQQEPRQPRHLPHTDPPAERKHQSGESLSISLPLSLCFSASLSPAQSSVDEDRNEVYSYYTSRVLPTTGPSLACLSSRRNSEYLIIKQRAEATIWDWRQSNWLMISLPAF